jgi:hypothetical protein
VDVLRIVPGIDDNKRRKRKRRTRGEEEEANWGPRTK